MPAQPQLKDKPAHSNEKFDKAAAELGLGDTEYRLNWIPLGGYVKMLGQDDMRVDGGAADFRKRAGVIHVRSSGFPGAATSLCAATI